MAKASLSRVSKTEIELVAPNNEGRERFPFTYEDTLKVRDLCKERGWRVTVEEKLRDWIKNETAKRNWPFEMIKQDTALGTALSQRPFQREGIQFVVQQKNVLIADEPGLGKRVINGTKVLTPQGYSNIENLQIDDLVIGSDGLPHKVTGVYPQGKHKTVKFCLTDGSIIKCCWGHLWTVEEMKQVGPQRKREWVRNTYTTEQLKIKGLTVGDGRKRFRLPMIEPVEFTDTPTSFDPYTLGVLIGDGSYSSKSIGVSTDHEIVEKLELLGDIAKLYQIKNCGYSGDYILSGRNIYNELERLGIFGQRSETKTIPREFMLSRSVDRIALLQGLLDTDGTAVQSRGKASASVEYGTVSRKLAHQVKFIVESLGGTASIATKTPTFTYNGEKKEGQLFYRMVLHLPSNITPFTLKRKIEKWCPRTKYEPYRYIDFIYETNAKDEMTCISIDSPDHLYAIENCVLTHNTLQAFSAVVESGCTGSILVVAPKTAAYVTWPHEIETWLHEVAPYDEWVIIGGKMTKLERIRAMKRVLRWDIGKGRIGPRQWVIVSPNYLRIKPKIDWRGNYVYNEDKEKILIPVREAIPALLAVDWKAVIVDECQETLSGASGDIKKQSAQRQGLGLLEIEDGLRIGLSGTPFRGKHENLWGTLNWLYPKRFTSYWHWVDTHFHIYIDPVTNARVIGGLKNEKSLSIELADLMIRRTKQEVAKELPRKRYGGTPLLLATGKPGPIAVWLDMFGQQRKAYEAMLQAAMVELEGGTLMANGVLAEMIRLKQFANSYGFMGGQDEFFPTFPSNKFDWIVDFLSERGIDGKGPGESKVLIASQFTKHVNLFSDRLREKHNIPCFTLTGQTSANARINLQRDFQRGTLESGEPAPDVFFINTKAGGTSLTLDAADDVVLIDSTFNADDQEQVENRVHRLSRLDHNVTIWNLCSTKSIDESIARHTFTMDMSIKSILDGSRGIVFAKMLLSDAI